MGEILNRLYPADLYVLGIYAGGGSYADNSGKTVSMHAPDSIHLDIKHLIGAMNGYAGFIHLPSKSRPGNHWLFNSIVVNDSFIDLNGTNRLILPKHFDGLLLLKHVSPPDPIE
jgi:erythromycin esterase-like protein